MTTADETPATMRIGPVAARTGLTPRAIRYYEQIGLLPGSAGRRKGGHRYYGEDDVQRLLLITRMRDLLGLSLDDLDELVAKGGAWQVSDRVWQESESMVDRLAIVDAATARIDLQLSLVQSRRDALAALEQNLLALRHAVDSKRL
jgi:DNA-binding transcriptional MerR regulator